MREEFEESGPGGRRGQSDRGYGGDLPAGRRSSGKQGRPHTAQDRLSGAGGAAAEGSESERRAGQHFEVEFVGADEHDDDFLEGAWTERDDGFFRGDMLVGLGSFFETERLKGIIAASYRVKSEKLHGGGETLESAEVAPASTKKARTTERHSFSVELRDVCVGPAPDHAGSGELEEDGEAGGKAHPCGLTIAPEPEEGRKASARTLGYDRHPTVSRSGNDDKDKESTQCGDCV